MIHEEGVILPIRFTAEDALLMFSIVTDSTGAICSTLSCEGAAHGGGKGK